MRWAYASAVHAGPGKAMAQDACAIRVHRDALVLAVSDGAGSAVQARTGATLVAQIFADQAWPLPESAFAMTADTLRPWAERLVSRIGAAIQTVAGEEDFFVADYAATLVGAVLTPAYAVFVQVGDGAAIIDRGAGFEVAIQPEPSEFVNATYFVTHADVKDHLCLRVVPGAVRHVALITDGLQPLVLQSNPRPGDGDLPHERFFETVFRNLRVEEGEDLAAAAWLGQMLCSDMVTRRTDDDTSIALARRTD